MAVALDVVVVGAGVIGMAAARAIARRGRSVVVLESGAVGQHTSSRNSEVIHAGLYYPSGSRKARTCVAGRRALYAFCEAASVPHRRIGKLVVATSDDELSQVNAIAQRAAQNGVDDLIWLDACQVARLEPNIRCVGALLSPSTGIVDSHTLMQALWRDASAHGATLVLRSPVLGGQVESDGFVLWVGGREHTTLRCKGVVNAAGLFAQQVARSIAGLAEATIPPAYFAKGHYFTLSGARPFDRLIYPVPTAHALGIHVTLDMSGQVRFGPDISWIDGIDYSFDESRRELFAAQIRRYYPALDATALQPGYTGIRPKLAPEGAPAEDFMVQDADVHGVAGLVNLYGLESPGLTASLALADEIAEVLERSI